MSKIKKIGIALAAYQPQLSYFEEQLSSIQLQTWKNWICLISFDSPVSEILENLRFDRFIKDPRFIWHENKTRKGHKKNFESAIQSLLIYEVDAIACSDQDDIWYPDKLSESIAALERAGSLSLVHCDMHILSGDKVGPETAWQVEMRGVQNCRPRDLLTRNVVAGCAMLFDSALAQRYPTIPAGCEYHDHWYALVASYFGGVHPLPQPLYRYRQHIGNALGVTPYVGCFALPHGIGWRGWVERFVRSWNASRMLAVDSSLAGLKLSWFDRWLYVSRWDFGAFLFGAAIKYLLCDPALSRAYFKRAIGKLLGVLIRNHG